MPLNTSQILADRLAIIGELSVNVTINGTTYQGRKTLNKNKKTYTEYGVVDSQGFSVHMTTNDAIYPGDVAAIGGNNYRVDSVDWGAVPGIVILGFTGEFQ